jgi:DNA invertase Pin-like site-specific DNA recombinase
MASPDLSPQPWHYTLEFPVDLIVPCASIHDKRPRRQVQYLHHPKCNAEDVLRLRAQGFSLRKIAQKFGVSTVTVSRVFNALKAANPELVNALPAIKHARRKKVD